MELREYLQLLRNHWLAILASALAGTVAGAVLALAQTPTYEADTKVYVSVRQGSSVQDLNQGGSFAQQIVKSYADVVATPIVLNDVISRLSLQASPAQLAKSITATAPLDTVIIDIRVEDTNAVRAANIANAIARRLSDIPATLSRGGTTSPVDITQIQAAVPPVDTASPSVPLYIAGGFAAGTAAMFFFVLGRRTLDTRVRSAADTKKLTPLSVIGTLPFDTAASTRTVLIDETGTASSESYRTLRTNLQFLDINRKVRTLVVTSSTEGEGKTTTVLNLGLTLAKAGARVVVLDADLRRPKLADYMGVIQEPGLSETLIGQVAIDDSVQQWGETGLDVVPAGSIPPNPSELLQSTAMSEVLDTLETRYDYVLIDTPPALSVTDAAVVTRYSSGALLVVAANKTTSAQLLASIETLSQVNAQLLGLVLTKVARAAQSVYRYDYGAETSEARRASRRGSRSKPGAP